MASNAHLFYFPLCAINFSKDVYRTFEHIISYCIVEYGYHLMDNFKLKDGDYNNIYNKVKNNSIKYYNQKSNEHDYFVFSSIKLNVSFHNMENLLFQHSEIRDFVENFERNYGNDAMVKVHGTLLFEVRDKKFDIKMFSVLCAIKSIIGKKEFVRITLDRLRYRMFGYKSKEVYKREAFKKKLLTDRQIKSIVLKLVDRGFIDRFTYKRRITYYSTRYKAGILKK